MTDTHDLALWLTDFRHELHRFPELSNEEFATTARLRNVLEQYQISILPLDLPTGLVVEIGGQNPGPWWCCVLILTRCPLRKNPALRIAQKTLA